MRITQFSQLIILSFSLFLAINANAQSQSKAESSQTQLQTNPNTVNQALNNVDQNTVIQSDSADLASNEISSNSKDDPVQILENNSAKQESSKLAHDLSVLGMYKGADIVVKIVMLGLVFASIVTWTIALAKGLEIFLSKRKLHKELGNLKLARTLKEASQSTDHKGVLSHLLVFEAITELNLSANNLVREGVKERVSFRLSRLIGNLGRNMSKGTGILATIGATAPFVGLFGTVWGIMNSFRGLAETSQANLATVAPGIAEALIATAIGLFAAIPAVIAYNRFSAKSDWLINRYYTFADEFIAILHRSLHK